MKVESPIISSTTTELRGVPLKQGQVLAAIVLRSSNAKGEALLSLAGGQLPVQTRLPLQAGTTLKLSVRELGPPVLMQPLPEDTGTAGSKSGQTIQTRLLTLLFQRTSQQTATSQSGTSSISNQGVAPRVATYAAATSTPAATMTQLSTALSAPATGSASPQSQLQSNTITTLTAVLMGGAMVKSPTLPLSALPAAVRMALPQLDAPPAPAIIATALAKLVTTYSLPVPGERLVNRDTTTTNDLKTQLKLAAQAIKSSLSTQSTPIQMPDARSAPAQQSHVLGTLTDWLNHMDISQLRTALQQVQGQASWVIDVPVVIAEHPRRLQLAVTQEDEGPTENGGSGTGWQLDFALDLPQFGPLHGSLHLQTTDLTVRLYADEPDARQRLTASLDRLDEQLRRANLNPQLSVYPGPPPAVVQARLSPEPRRPDDTSQHSWRV